MALTGLQFPIAAGDHRVTVVEVGAGLRSYVVGGKDVTFTYGDDDLPPGGCGAVLVPWPNRLRGGTYSFDRVTYQLPLTEPGPGNAIHGLGRWARWTAIRHEPAAVTLALDIPPQPGWPFEVRVEVSYELHPEHGLAVTTVARNTGSRRAPFGAGFHPYLSLRGRSLAEVTLQVPATQRLVTDDARIPVGVQSVMGTAYDLRRRRRLRDLRLDDAFTQLHTDHGRGVAQMRTPAGGATVWFDESFRYVQVYTPDLLARGLPAVAVEPMTCAADAFNSRSGLLVLEPGGSWTGTWGIQPI